MKETSSNEKTSSSQTNDVAQHTSAGPEGITIAPPAYGIQSADSLVAQPAPIQRMEGESATGGEAGSPPPNRTGLPDTLKSGVESLSGFSLDDVRVHYNSPKPAGLSALAYTQGTDIHVAPGQERHLPHEAWHVVQQKQGRVKTTFQMKGIAINDESGLESEADVMGMKATQLKAKAGPQLGSQKSLPASTFPVQMKSQIVKLEHGTPEHLFDTNPDLAIKLLGADSVVDENAERLARRTGAEVQELSPANQRFPADWIRGVTNLYIIGHGSKGRLAGMNARRLAGNVYPAIYEEVKKIHPIHEIDRYSALSQQVKIETIDIVACHSAEDYLNPETNQISSFAKDFYGFMKNLNQEFGRSLSVSGVNGYAFVDYEGDVRAIPEEVIEKYRGEKKGLKSDKDRTRVLDKYARTDDAIKKFIYDPETQSTLEASTAKKPKAPLEEDVLDDVAPKIGLAPKHKEDSKESTSTTGKRTGKKKGFCFITTACTEARGLPDDCLELTTLRAFRDEYIMGLAKGREMVKVYYQNSPAIVEAINGREDAPQIYDELYEIICRCVRDVQNKEYERAFQTYVQMVIELRNRFTPLTTVPAFFYRAYQPTM